jgi:hypothetical protein
MRKTQETKQLLDKEPMERRGRSGAWERPPHVLVVFFLECCAELSSELLLPSEHLCARITLRFECCTKVIDTLSHSATEKPLACACSQGAKESTKSTCVRARNTHAHLIESKCVDGRCARALLFLCVCSNREPSEERRKYITASSLVVVVVVVVVVVLVVVVCVCVWGRSCVYLLGKRFIPLRIDALKVMLCGCVFCRKKRTTCFAGFFFSGLALCVGEVRGCSHERDLLFHLIARVGHHLRVCVRASDNRTPTNVSSDSVARVVVSVAEAVVVVVVVCVCVCVCATVRVVCVVHSIAPQMNSNAPSAYSRPHLAAARCIIARVSAEIVQSECGQHDACQSDDGQHATGRLGCGGQRQLGCSCRHAVGRLEVGQHAPLRPLRSLRWT